MVNKVTLLGNLGQDPEIKVLGSGKKVASFSLATSKSYKDKSGKKITDTQWHNISVWGPLADVVERYLVKGSQIYLEGEINYRSYEDKTGAIRWVTNIVASTLTMLGKKDSSIKEPSEETKAAYTHEAEALEDDLPF